VTQPRLHRILLVGALLAYLALALPLPFVLLDHEWGILTGDLTHSADDDHAWLDHAAGDGMAASDAGVAPDTLMTGDPFPDQSFVESRRVHLPSARGPPHSSAL
jgi:hypothetical protein